MLDHKGFYPRSRLKSMSNAWRGIKIMFRGQYNIWIHTMILGLVVMAGIYFSITLLEWIFIIFAAGMVFAAEAFNTAIEIDMNLTSPEFHPHARDTKDVAAGAVLITAIVALLVGIIIFLPRFVVLMLWQ
ncbi:MAG: diacylglycerol kinase family protein [Candidatus Pacebacteria bacterium]|nr:diacylglycerol kinase family protein [Candidatus Paceibacterota bacterium]MBP9852161.1 diacylglycerol kinase family protein [Candidatus Paceibacterota bacterium]